MADGAACGRLREENRRLREQLVRQEEEIAFRDLDLRDEIGGGGFSVVHRALWHGAPVAVKQWFDPSMSDELLADFRGEVSVLHGLRHPHIVQFLGACSKPPHLCAVFEYLPHTLHGILHESRVPLDTKRALDVAKDAARALCFLHSRSPKVVHRDAKPANFLLDRAWKVKLCDFGLVADPERKPGHGTPNYMAPELFAGGAYDEKVDVYAFGVVLWELVAREVPWGGAAAPEIKRAVLAGERPQIPLSCSKPLAALIGRCWHADSRARPACPDLLEALKGCEPPPA